MSCGVYVILATVRDAAYNIGITHTLLRMCAGCCLRSAPLCVLKYVPQALCHIYWSIYGAMHIIRKLCLQKNKRKKNIYIIYQKNLKMIMRAPKKKKEINKYFEENRAPNGKGAIKCRRLARTRWLMKWNYMFLHVQVCVCVRWTKLVDVKTKIYCNNKKITLNYIAHWRSFKTQSTAHSASLQDHLTCFALQRAEYMGRPPLDVSCEFHFISFPFRII